MFGGFGAAVSSVVSSGFSALTSSFSENSSDYTTRSDDSLQQQQYTQQQQPTRDPIMSDYYGLPYRL